MMTDNIIWSRDNILLLIDHLKLNKCLWDIKCLDYRNKYRKKRAYQNILQELISIMPLLDITNLKKKINIIRTQFRRESRKEQNSQKSGVGTADLYTPTL